MRNRLLILSLVIIFLSVLSTVSANDGNDVQISDTQDLEPKSDTNTPTTIKKDNTETNNKITNTPTTTQNNTNTNNQISQSKIKGSNYVAYTGVKNPYKVVLTLNNVPLANKNIKFVIKGKTYYKKTNNNGEAILNINLKKGTYTINYYFAGETHTRPSKGSSKIYVKKGMPTHFKRISSTNYFSKIIKPFKVKLLDSRGKALYNKKIVFKVNNKKYTRRTNKKGIASISINLKQGTYKVTYSFKKTATYKKASGSSKIHVKTYIKPYKELGNKNNGVWLRSSDMNYIDLDKLAKYGINHIFLNAKAVTQYGKNKIESFISTAKTKGINIHIWMQIFKSNEKWESPVTSSGTYKYNLINSKIELAKQYASIKGVAGINFDYLRFPGNAYKYKNGINAINSFVGDCSIKIREVNSKVIVSASVMAESMTSMKTAYGQDIPTLSKYLDVIIPMAYKGNYKKDGSWIQKVTNNFVKNSKGAQTWTGLQTYVSDNDLSKLSSKELLTDVRLALMGGANGIVLFRHGLTNYVDFNTV